MTTSDEKLPGEAFVRGTDLAVDDLYDVLASRHRRFVIDYLVTHSGSTQLAEVAVELARWEGDASPDGMADEAVASRRIELHHVHLPKLADAGIVEYDGERKTVALAGEFDDELLQQLPPIE